MKSRVIILVGAATMFLGLVSAQTASTQMTQDTTPNASQNDKSGTTGQNGARHRRMAGKISRELGLSDAQKTQLKSFREQQAAELQALRNDSSLTQEQRRAKFMEIRKAGRTQFEGLLTPEQLTKMQEARQHRGGGPRRGHGRRGGRGAKPGTGTTTGTGIDN